MSGSSLDGVDLALCDFQDQHHYTLLRSACIPYTNVWVSRLRAGHTLDIHGLCQLEADYTDLMAQMLATFIGEDRIDYIASHGHTLLHAPNQGYSYQLGQGSYLSAKLGVSVISEFRLQDIAKGGQGAPIAPIVESYLYSGYGAYLNLGGICNISIHEHDQVTAYDIGPCNQLLNALAGLKGMDYDRDGQLAHQGRVIPALLRQVIAHPFYHQSHPKSLDNEYVQSELVAVFLSAEGTVEDRLRTGISLICQIIDDAIPDSLTRVLATGGGALNKMLIGELKQRLDKRGINLIIPNKETIEYKEAILMALMGYLRVNNIPNVYCSVTGASTDTIAGAIYL